MPITPAKLPHTADEVVDAANFFNRVLPLYERGVGDIELDADLDTARSVVPAASGATRDFSYIAPEIPEFIASNCVGCMDCVTECPDTAILGKVIPKSQIDAALEEMMLANTALQYVGGAGSCAGCGEASVLRMFIAETCYKYGTKNVGHIAA